MKGSRRFLRRLLRPMTDLDPIDTRRFELRAYERLAELYPRLLAEETLESLLDAIADAVEELLPCSAVMLYGIRESDGALLPLVVRGVAAGQAAGPFTPTEDSLEALAIASALPLDPALARASGLKPTLRGEGLEASAAVPLVVRSEPIGCLTIRRRGVGQLFGDEELRFLARLADVMAITLDNARSRAQLADLAQTDALTGLLNRRGFFSALDRTLAQAQRDGRETSVVTVDVDDLKRINDRFGHSVGDDALKSIAATLSGRTRRGDIVGRLGGDEFAVVLPRADAEATADIRRELQSLLEHVRLDTVEGELEFCASFGIASTGRRDLTAEKLVSLSDLDMYESKNRRRQHSTHSS